jgi:hypothetical protein
MAGAAVGPLNAGLLRLTLLFEKSRRRCIEFRGDGILLTPRGARLRLTYRFGLGRKNWTMLLDDDAQILELRHALASQIPPEKAA